MPRLFGAVSAAASEGLVTRPASTDQGATGAAGQGANTLLTPCLHFAPPGNQQRGCTEEKATLSCIGCLKEASPLYPTPRHAGRSTRRSEVPGFPSLLRKQHGYHPRQHPACLPHRGMSLRPSLLPPPWSRRSLGEERRMGRGWLAQNRSAPHPPPLVLPRKLFSIEGSNLPPVPRYRRQRATLPTHCQICAASERALPH